jgi:hypothetical protein
MLLIQRGSQEDRVRLTAAQIAFIFFFFPKSKTLSLKMTDDLPAHHDYLLKTGNFSMAERNPVNVKHGQRFDWSGSIHFKNF